MKKHLLLYSLLFFTATVFSQFQVSGSLIDKSDQKPLPGAHVYLHNDEGKLIHLVTTDYQGAFSFSELHSGHYSIKCSYVGYHDLEKNITITDKNIFLDKLFMEIMETRLGEVSITECTLPVLSFIL